MKRTSMIARPIEEAAALEPKNRLGALPIATLGFLLCLLIPSVHAQLTGKQAYAFRGKVEQVNTSPKPLTVTNEPIEGWMGKMTMAYAVDKPEVLKKIKAGDQIKATVYDGDYSLHNVEVVSPAELEK